MSPVDPGYQRLFDEILTELRSARKDISEIQQTIAEKRGERRMLLLLSGAVSGLVSLALGFFK